MVHFGFPNGYSADKCPFLSYVSSYMYHGIVKSVILAIFMTGYRGQASSYGISEHWLVWLGASHDLF